MRKPITLKEAICGFIFAVAIIWILGSFVLAMVDHATIASHGMRNSRASTMHPSGHA